MITYCIFHSDVYGLPVVSKQLKVHGENTRYSSLYFSVFFYIFSEPPILGGR